MAAQSYSCPPTCRRISVGGVWAFFAGPFLAVLDSGVFGMIFPPFSAVCTWCQYSTNHRRKNREFQKFLGFTRIFHILCPPLACGGPPDHSFTVRTLTLTCGCAILKLLGFCDFLMKNV